MRPVLSPALRRLWRDDTTLQLGVHPRHAVVLAGVVEPVGRLLELLDGTRTSAEVVATSATLGVDEATAVELLTLLERCGALDDASADHQPLTALPLEDRDRLQPDLAALGLQAGGLGAALSVLRRRRAASVEVVGAGRVGAAVAMLLGAAGVGRVTVTDAGAVTPGDVSPGGLTRAHVDRSRPAAVAELLTTTFPGVVTAAAPDGRRPDLVVLCPREGRPAEALGDTTHLVAAVRETVGSVGPLVVPGRSCCLRCLDLHRAERDPDWPALRAQLSGHARGTEACDTTLATQVAAVAVGAAKRWLDTGGSDLVGATLELSLDEWRPRRRSWSPHPDCGCIARSEAAA